MKSDPVGHLTKSAISVKHCLNPGELRDKETSTHLDAFIRTLLGEAATSNTKLSPFQQQQYRSLLDRLTPEQVNRKYSELRLIVRIEQNHFAAINRKPSGYEGHDYNGIVSQLSMDAQKCIEMTALNKQQKKVAKIRRQEQKNQMLELFSKVKRRKRTDVDGEKKIRGA